MEVPWPPGIRLGALLLREGLVTPEQLELALVEQLRVQRRLGEILVEWGWVSHESIARALAEQYELDYVDLATCAVDPEAVALLPPELARRHRALPVERLADGRVLVAVADPTDAAGRNELEAALGSAVCLAVADEAELERRLGAVGAA